MPFDVNQGASVPYKNGLLVVGGYNRDIDFYFDYLDTILYYDPDSDRWSEMQNLKEKRELLTAFTVPDAYAMCT